MADSGLNKMWNFSLVQSMQISVTGLNVGILVFRNFQEIVGLFPASFCPALTKLALDLHVNFCLFVCLFFQSFFQGVELDDILASDSGSGNLLIRLGV